MIRGGPKDNLLRTLAAAIAIAAPAVAHSADFTFVGTQVTMTGEIVDGDSKKFDKTIGTKLVRSMVLESKGGDVIEALDIGEKLRGRLVDTAVAPNSYCASACALIWAAGTRRSIADGGRVGFHGVYSKDEQRGPVSIGNALVGAYLMKLGYDYPAVVYAVAAPPTEMKWLNPSDAMDTGFTYEAKNVVEAAASTKKPVLTGCAVAAAQLKEELGLGSSVEVSCKD